jgi:multimeric flavodoxin WrbA
MTTKIVGLCGSPIEGGNCEQLRKVALKAAEETGDVETELITLADKRIEYCRHCQKCIEKKVKWCAIDDDAPMIYDKMEATDGLIVGSPIYIGSVPGKLESLIDRTRVFLFFKKNIMMYKASGIVVTGWFRNQGTELCIHRLEFWLQRGMGMVPSDYVAVGVSSTGAIGEYPMKYVNGGVMKDKTGLYLAERVGQRVAQRAKEMQKIRPLQKK